MTAVTPLIPRDFPSDTTEYACIQEGPLSAVQICLFCDRWAPLAPSAKQTALIRTGRCDAGFLTFENEGCGAWISDDLWEDEAADLWEQPVERVER